MKICDPGTATFYHSCFSFPKTPVYLKVYIVIVPIGSSINRGITYKTKHKGNSFKDNFINVFTRFKNLSNLNIYSVGILQYATLHITHRLVWFWFDFYILCYNMSTTPPGLNPHSSCNNCILDTTSLSCLFLKLQMPLSWLKIFAILMLTSYNSNTYIIFFYLLYMVVKMVVKRVLIFQA